MVRSILDQAEARPDLPFRFVDLSGEITETTLGKLVGESVSLAGSLHAHGLAEGDVVAIRGSNTLHYSRALLAAVLGGFIAAPLVSLLGDADVTQLLRLANAKILLSEASGPKRSLVRHLRELADGGELDVVLLGNAPPHLDGAVRLPGDGEWHITDAKRRDDDAAFYIFTSGTTGTPKGVVHSYRSLYAEVSDLAAHLGLVDDGHQLQAFPLGHVAGLDNLLVSACLGREMTMLSAWDARPAADLIERYGITTMAATPFYGTTLFDEFHARGRRTTSLRTMLNGGGSVGSALVRRGATFGIEVRRCYGSSEHPSATCHVPGASLALRSSTDGRPTGGTRIRVVDDAGQDLPTGADGEILLSGGEQFTGYLPGTGDSITGDGWFRTGDIGRLSADGHLSVTGRKKDIIIRGGENISAAEVEQLLGGFPGILEAAVVPVPDDRYGEKVGAFFVQDPGHATVDPDAVRAYFRRLGVAQHKAPEYLRSLDELPRNSLGKIQKHQLPPLGPV